MILESLIRRTAEMVPKSQFAMGKCCSKCNCKKKSSDGEKTAVKSLPAPINEIPGSSGDQTTCLYAGDLPLEVTVAMLSEKFSEFGKITSIQIYRDYPAPESLGYAYINFENASDAKRAMEALNMSSLINTPIHVALYEENYLNRPKVKVKSLFIKNMDPSISTKDVYDIFYTFGNIVSCKMNSTGISKTYAFIEFEINEQSKKVIEDTYSTLFVTGERLFAKEEVEPRFICVENFPKSFDDEQLKKLFLPYGEVTSCHIILNQAGISRRFAYVSFLEPKSAQKATDQLKDYERDGKMLRFVHPHSMEDPKESASLNERSLWSEFKRCCRVFTSTTESMTIEEWRTQAFSSVCFHLTYYYETGKETTMRANKGGGENIKTLVKNDSKS